jgi:hypothetical protein
MCPGHSLASYVDEELGAFYASDFAELPGDGFRALLRVSKAPSQQVMSAGSARSPGFLSV